MLYYCENNNVASLYSLVWTKAIDLKPMILGSNPSTGSPYKLVVNWSPSKRHSRVQFPLRALRGTIDDDYH